MNILNAFGGVTRLLQMVVGVLITGVGVSVAVAGSKTGKAIGGTVLSVAAPETIPAREAAAEAKEDTA